MKPLDSSGRVAEVLRLGLVEGVAVRAIAKRLHMARKTVRKILGRHRAPPKPAGDPRGSILDPYEPAIRAVLDDTPEMLAPAVLERLRPLGYTGGVSILRDRLRHAAASPAARSVSHPRLCAGRSDAGRLGRLWLRAARLSPAASARFVLALCHSRHLYSNSRSASHGLLPALHGAGLRFYGGVTSADIFDNMKTVVLSHTPTATVFNPQFLEYARARGFAVRACNVRQGNEKGRVERPIGFVRERFWLGRRFVDLLDLNHPGVRVARRGRQSAACTRSPARSQQLVFEHEEKRRAQAHSRRPPSTPTTSEAAWA